VYECLFPAKGAAESVLVQGTGFGFVLDRKSESTLALGMPDCCMKNRKTYPWDVVSIGLPQLGLSET
jgi:hypothetical protein